MAMVRRLPGREGSRIANSPLQLGAQTCTVLFAFGESRGYLPCDKRSECFSAIGCSGRILKIPAKRNGLRALASYFSDSSDLMAEKSGFELSIQVYTANPRLIRKLQIARGLRENLIREAQAKRSREVVFSFVFRSLTG
jgi:hypothetical protein